MSTEYIRMVLVCDDGVYLNSKSNNDNLPYRTWRCDSLTDIYRQEGREGLDREIIQMFCEYAAPKGSHSSLRKYMYALSPERYRSLHQDYLEKVNSAFDKLSDKDKETRYTEPTEAAKQYFETEHQLRRQKYTDLALLCAEYDRTIRDEGRVEQCGEKD